MVRPQPRPHQLTIHRKELGAFKSLYAQQCFSPSHPQVQAIVCVVAVSFARLPAPKWVATPLCMIYSPRTSAHFFCHKRVSFLASSRGPQEGTPRLFLPNMLLLRPL